MLNLQTKEKKRERERESNLGLFALILCTHSIVYQRSVCFLPALVLFSSAPCCLLLDDCLTQSESNEERAKYGSQNQYGVDGV
jgi:hypothetical protein